MLRRELYRGRIVWNKMRRVDRGGTRTKVRRPDSEWLTLDAPDLRIIDDALWQSAHAVLDGKAGAYIRLAGGKLIGRPEGTRESPFLLTGLARCGWCRGSMYSITRLAKGQAWTYYGCYYNRSRGAHVCRNRLTVPQAAANRLVRDALATDVLTPERVKRIVDQTLSAWHASRSRPTRDARSSSGGANSSWPRSESSRPILPRARRGRSCASRLSRAGASGTACRSSSRRSTTSRTSPLG
jgi:site-specific DNA recombinase